MSFYRLAASILLVSVFACGGGDAHGDSTANGGSSGNAAAGAATGGSSVSGSSGTAGSMTSGGPATGGGPSTGAHCTPGTPKPAESYIGSTLDSCPSVSGLTGNVENILDIALGTPVGPGQTFAFSVDLTSSEGDFELYGATRECGDVGEKLSTIHVKGNGIICHEVKPVTGTYSHMIWVWRVAAGMKDTAVCESGTCPAP